MTLPRGAEIFGIIIEDLEPILVALIDPEEASAQSYEFFQVGPNEPFDTEGLRFVGYAGTGRYVWVKLSRTRYQPRGGFH